MVQWALVSVMFHLAAPSPWASLANIAFHEDPFGAGFSGDAIYFVNRNHAGEEMTVLAADIPDLCNAIRTRHGELDVRVWVAEVTQRGGDALHVGTGNHVILTDDGLYDDSFGHRGGVAMVTYIHKRAGVGHAPAFVGMAARGLVNIATFDAPGGDVVGDYHATFRLGSRVGMGFLQAASDGHFRARYCPEGLMWQQALLGANAA